MTTDVFSPENRSAVMRRVKGRDTAPELAVRRILRAAGIGYRLGGAGLPGRPDLVMQGRRAVVFVHGCFWHGHDCARGARQPKANAAYWTAKIDRNRARDAASRAALEAGGWRVVTVWECGMKAGDFPARLVAGVRGQAAADSASSSA
ncbi:MAG: very short patch repair endonuclease [Brevundimonas sp.]|uniref:very short patch repair endonuclease n=1 Tax=Brevundimonas sp. TaxID=1871086 RepID=UPI00391A7C4A